MYACVIADVVAEVMSSLRGCELSTPRGLVVSSGVGGGQP